MAKCIVTCLFACILGHVTSNFSTLPLTTFIGTTINGCRELCSKRPSCRSVMYSRRAAYCELFDRTFFEPGSGRRRRPGIIYRDARQWPELNNQTRACHGLECSSGEVCDGACIVTECPAPPPIPGTTVSGNRLQVRSKLRYDCINMYTKETILECQVNGTWTAVDLQCDSPAYDLYGTDTFMLVDMTGIYYFEHFDSFMFQSDYLDSCLAQCNASTKYCVGVNFNPENGTCISTSIQPGLNTPYKPKNLQEWRYYFKKMPILHSDENYKGRYAFNFEQGKDLCKSLNTSLASKDEVQLAYDLGFSLCKCGWVTEGVSVIAIHHVFKLCFDVDQAGVYDCWEADTFDVFCKNPLF